MTLWGKLTSATGLGDIIATGSEATRLDKAAEWFARVILRRESCGCAKRRAVLNSLIPFLPPTLCIGIPHRNDLEGIHETTLSIRREVIGKSIRWYGRKVPLSELIRVVIVNQPNTVQDSNGNVIVDQEHVSRQLNGWAASCTQAGVRTEIVEFAEVYGTAPAKQQACFAAAKAGSEWVMILDSHVVFVEGILHRLMKWLRRHRNRMSRDLFHGYLKNDNDVHGYTGLTSWDSATGLPLIGADNLWGKWTAHPEAHADNPPDRIPIDACGGWCVLSRVDQTVPSIDQHNQQHMFPFMYHPLMRGFGGEESIIHEMRRANGGEVYSLPWLRAYHRFMRTHRVFYNSGWTDALRNQAIAFYELRARFAERCSRFVDCDSPLDLLAAAWIKAGKPEEDVLRVIADAVAEVREAWAKHPHARRIGQPQTAQPVTDDAAPQSSGQTDDVDAQFAARCAEPSDINEHLPKLRELASQCSHITEFGTRTGVSTTALLAARPKTIVTYDISSGCQCKRLDKLVPTGTELIKRHGKEFDTATMPVIDATDMLLVDTLHTADHVAAELERHSARVSKYIVFHDTEAPWGNADEGGGNGGGVRAGIARWQATSAGEGWSLTYEAKNNHGLQVWSKK